MTALTDAQALYRAILHAPEDDTARLVYADALEESAGTVECPTCKGKRKVRQRVERKFQDATRDVTGMIRNWDKVIDCPTCSGTGRIPDGLAARAEFVRVGVELELARIKECPLGHSDAFHVDEYCSACDPIHSRHSALLREHEASWRRGERCDDCVGKGIIRVDTRPKGGPFSGPEKRYVYEPPEFVDIACPTCHGIGWLGPLAEPAGPGTLRTAPGDAYGRWRYPAEWQRGLIHRVHAPLADIWDAEHEQPTEWAVRVRGEWPVTEWAVTDREPDYDIMRNTDYGWYGANVGLDDPPVIPTKLCKALVGFEEREWDTEFLGYDLCVTYPSADVARHAIATVLGSLVEAEWKRREGNQTPAAPDERG